MTPRVAVCTLTANRRLGEHSAAIPHHLDYPNMVYYVNFQNTNGPVEKSLNLENQVEALYPGRYYFDFWTVDSKWMTTPKFDQDQARLVPICMARNMARMFAASQDAEWLLFLDSDVVVPPDSIQRLLEVAVNAETGEIEHYIIGGVVPGRGVHSNSGKLTDWINWAREKTVGGKILKQLPGYYVFWMHSPYKTYLNGRVAELAVVQHATMGFVMIHRDVYERLGFTSIATDRYYTDPEGVTNVGLSEDPAFGIYANTYMNAKWVVRLDLLAEHLGDLYADATAQF